MNVDLEWWQQFSYSRIKNWKVLSDISSPFNLKISAKKIGAFHLCMGLEGLTT